MTEERFKMADGNYPQIVVFDGDIGLSYFDMIELLNKQNEQIDFLADILSKLSAYMIALGFDIELEYKDGRTINLTDVMNDDR